MAVRQVKDVDQAQRLLIVRRKKRMANAQRQQQQNIQLQAQMNAQVSQQKAQLDAQRIQLEAQADAQKMQLKGQVDIQVAAAMHEMRKEIEIIKSQSNVGSRKEDKEFRQKLEILKEDRKDQRVEKQAVEQSKLISQRQGRRGEIQGEPDSANEIINQILGDV
jgi:hypothetical protein